MKSGFLETATMAMLSIEPFAPPDVQVNAAIGLRSVAKPKAAFRLIAARASL